MQGKMTCLSLLLAGAVLAVLAVPAQAERAQRGKFDVPLGLGNGVGTELVIMEPEMCAGSAHAEVSWNQRANLVKVKAKFDGLPYRRDFCYEVDVNQDYFQASYPQCIEEARWQIWLVGRNGTRTSTFFWDGVTLDFIGNIYDLDGPPPANAIALEIPVVQMVCSEIFESDPDSLEAEVNFHFQYDQILDVRGTGGTFFTVVPRNLGNPFDVFGYYTTGGLPVEEAMDFDDILGDVAAGSGLIIATSAEPFPKPPFLHSRSNVMPGWAGVGPSDQPLPAPDPCATVQVVGAWFQQ
jgi:hypothetical protein